MAKRKKQVLFSRKVLGSLVVAALIIMHVLPGFLGSVRWVADILLLVVAIVLLFF